MSLSEVRTRCLLEDLVLERRHDDGIDHWVEMTIPFVSQRTQLQARIAMQVLVKGVSKLASFLGVGGRSCTGGVLFRNAEIPVTCREAMFVALEFGPDDVLEPLLLLDRKSPTGMVNVSTHF
jgi:hypothetical protein